MAKQTSINVQPVKGGSEEHNKRKKKLDYVRKDLSHLNEYWECDTQANRLANIKALYQSKTGQKMQAKATPIREGVVVIQESTTMQTSIDWPMLIAIGSASRSFKSLSIGTRAIRIQGLEAQPPCASCV